MNYWLGQIIMGGWNFAPRTSTTCDGQLMAISQNTALFSLLGTNFGGDGRTTFGLPDLRGRSPMHWGSGPGISTKRIGQKGGAELVTLTVSEIPSHSHKTILKASDEDANSDEAEDNVLANATIYHGGAPNVNMSNSSVQVSPIGGSQPHNNQSPFQCVTFVIMLQGIYPSRS